MLSLAIFVGFERFARSAGFALCAALRIRIGGLRMRMCVCVCVLSIICFRELPTHTQPTHASAQRPRFVCPQPRLVVVVVRVSVFVCVSACVRACIYGLWQ